MCKILFKTQLVPSGFQSSLCGLTRFLMVFVVSMKLMDRKTGKWSSLSLSYPSYLCPILKIIFRFVFYIPVFTEIFTSPECTVFVLILYFFLTFFSKFFNSIFDSKIFSFNFWSSLCKGYKYLDRYAYWNLNSITDVLRFLNLTRLESLFERS